LRREYTARQFNRDPSAISRAARRFGRVMITNRGIDSLVVIDAAQYRQLVPASQGPATVLESFAMDEAIDEARLGEPPRMRLALRTDLT
jgi:hypothetical protein